MRATITGSELKTWREQHRLNLEEVGQMLGGVTGPTVSRWEGGQDIPGPAQLLLRLLMHGEMPFSAGGQAGAESAAVREEARHFWSLRLTLEDWHKLEALAAAGGFATVRDYLMSLIQEHLSQQRKEATPPEEPLPNRRDVRYGK